LGEYLLRWRSKGPYFMSIMGIGLIVVVSDSFLTSRSTHRNEENTRNRRSARTHAMRRARKPRRDDAHCVPSFSYIWVANKGNAAPKVDRTTVVAARAEAAAQRYTSMM
jgi:hypothetical protein